MTLLSRLLVHELLRFPFVTGPWLTTLLYVLIQLIQNVEG